MSKSKTNNPKYEKYKKLQTIWLIIFLVCDALAILFVVLGFVFTNTALWVVGGIFIAIAAISGLVALKSPYATYLNGHCSNCGESLFGAAYEAVCTKQNVSNNGTQANLTYDVTYTCPHCGEAGKFGVYKYAKNLL